MHELLLRVLIVFLSSWRKKKYNFLWCNITHNKKTKLICMIPVFWPNCSFFGLLCNHPPHSFSLSSWTPQNVWAVNHKFYLWSPLTDWDWTSLKIHVEAKRKTQTWNLHFVHLLRNVTERLHTSLPIYPRLQSREHFYPFASFDVFQRV